MKTGIVILMAVVLALLVTACEPEADEVNIKLVDSPGATVQVTGPGQSVNVDDVEEGDVDPENKPNQQIRRPQ